MQLHESTRFFTVSYISGVRHTTVNKLIVLRPQELSELATGLDLVDYIVKAHVTFLGLREEDIHVNEWSFSGDFVEVAKSVSDCVCKRLASISSYNELCDVYRSLQTLEKSIVKYDYDIMYYDENDAAIRSKSEGVLENTLTSDVQHLYIYRLINSNNVQHCVRKDNYLPLLKRVLYEIQFYDQIFDLPSDTSFDLDHFMSFTSTLLSKCGQCDFENGDKIEKIICGTLDVMDVPRENRLTCNKQDEDEDNDDQMLYRASDETVEHFRARVVGVFVSERVKTTQGSTVPSSQMFTTFSNWMETHVRVRDRSLFNKNNFTPVLRMLGYTTKRTPSGVIWTDTTVDGEKGSVVITGGCSDAKSLWVGSNSATTGAHRVTGGVGIGGNLNVGGNYGSNSSEQPGVVTFYCKTSGSPTVAEGTGHGEIVDQATVDSSSSNSGALVVSGITAPNASLSDMIVRGNIRLIGGRIICESENQDEQVSKGVITTQASTLYIAGEPIIGTNETV